MLGLSPLGRVYLQVIMTVPGFLIVMAPLQYEVQSMVCEVYYSTHERTAAGCALPEVDAQVAAALASISMLALVTCAIGVVFATVCAKRYGLRATLSFCILTSVLINLFYLAAMHIRGEVGLALMFLAQLTIALGGVGGGHSCVITIVSLIAPKGSTSATLGTLGGLAMLVGSAASAVAGYIYEWHPQAPFVIAALLFLISGITTPVLIPSVPIAPVPDGARPLDVLRILAPRKVQRAGKELKDYSMLFAGLGTGLSIVATSYTGAEVSIWGMNSFGVTPSELGALGAWGALSKGIFLILFFPRLSKAAFRYLDRKNKSLERQPLLDAPEGEDSLGPEGEGYKPSPDLYLLFTAIVLELAAVLCLAFATQKWHLFALTTFIPSGAGAGTLFPALLVHFVPDEKKPEAVGAAALVTQCSAISAILIFGYLFAWLSKLELARLVFLANGLVGLLALLTLLFVRSR